MKVKDICEMLKMDFPLSLAFDGDNVGLLVGDEESKVTKLLLTCDVDESVVSEAKDIGAQMIVSHHPLMFNKINRLTENEPEQRALRLLIKNGISFFAAHTNLDTVNGGLNDYMASLLKLRNTSVIDKVAEDNRGVHGYGRIGSLDNEITLKELMDRVIKIFNADGVRFSGDLNRRIKTVAVNTGGGSGVIFDSISLGADVLITGDVKYNGYRDASDRGMCIIDLMHYDSEHIVMDFYENYFKNADIETVKSKSNINVVKTYMG